MKPASGKHPIQQAARARSAFVAARGAEAEAARLAEIEGLAVVAWKGRTLRTIRCTGTSGRGPHDVHVPEALLWSLMDLARYRCVYHAGAPTDAPITPKDHAE